MAETHAVAISGSPRSPSKSKALAEMMLAALKHAGCETQMVDVAELPAEALVARASAPEMDAAIATVAAAQIIIAASPTYRALYTGVMKAFFDLLPPAFLANKVCVPIQTGGSMAHFLSVEYGMRPLFASLEGIAIAGVYAADDQFVDGAPVEKLAARVDLVANNALAVARGLAG